MSENELQCERPTMQTLLQPAKNRINLITFSFMFNIALNTFRELARNKILYMIVFFGVALIGFSLVLATLSLGQSDKIVVDFGLAMVEIFGIISVIFI